MIKPTKEFEFKQPKLVVVKIGGRKLKVPYASESELKAEIAEFKAFKKNPVKYIKKTLNNA